MNRKSKQDDFYREALEWLDSGRYEEQVPDSILEAIRSLDIMNEKVAGAVGGSFFNIAWKHPETEKHFTCTGRFAASIVARQRNLHVKGQKECEIGDLFGLYKDWQDEIYLDWFSEAVGGGFVFGPFGAAMAERGWEVDHGYWEREAEKNREMEQA